MTPDIGIRDRLVRRAFLLSQKDKHLKMLARRFWQGVAVTIDGLSFELFPTDNSTERNLYLNRVLEERESLDALAHEISNRRCLIYDIGANCGLYSMFLARAAGAGSIVHAFEPSPVMAGRLKRNIEANNLRAEIELHTVALSSDRGLAYLNVHRRNHGQSSLRELDQSDNAVEVQQLPLADIYNGRDDFEKFAIKIDVEGREDDVLYPFISSCDHNQLPDVILLEMVLEQKWGKNLRNLLEQKGYRISFQGDGNALFRLDHPSSVS